MSCWKGESWDMRPHMNRFIYTCQLPFHSFFFSSPIYWFSAFVAAVYRLYCNKHELTNDTSTFYMPRKSCRLFVFFVQHRGGIFLFSKYFRQSFTVGKNEHKRAYKSTQTPTSVYSWPKSWLGKSMLTYLERRSRQKLTRIARDHLFMELFHTQTNISPNIQNCCSFFFNWGCGLKWGLVFYHLVWNRFKVLVELGQVW